MREFRFTVTKEDEGSGVKKILRRHFDFSSRLFIKLNHQNLVFLNDELLQGWMQPKAGDVIRAVMPEERSHFPEEDIPVKPAYEDQDLLIIDKPPGYTVHPTKGHADHTMANGIMKYMREQGEEYKIRFVNRLDMDTSGLLIVGKNSHAQDDLTRQMQRNSLGKYYQAIVEGIIKEDQLAINLPIGLKSPDQPARTVTPEGKPSLTRVWIEKRFPSGYTLIRIKLETGRTHQIRVHLSHIGHPLLGDPLYGHSSPMISRQALHAFRIDFIHPAWKTAMRVTAPLPQDFLHAIEEIEKSAGSSYPQT